MHEQNMVFAIFMIFTGAAFIATAALYTRQSLLIAYIVVGALVGPWGFGLISEPRVVNQTGEVGIIFLLFLIGLHLHPQKLLQMLRKSTEVALFSSLAFALVSFGIAFYFGYSTMESFIIGLAMMFSSTIIGLKLLPTTVLHHQHTGELMISVLLVQDILAILALLTIKLLSNGGASLHDIGVMLIGLPGLLVFAFLVERFVLYRLVAKFNRIQEYVFLLAIAWCLSLTEMADSFGLSAEIGALIAGVSLASNPISLHIAESLKPLRDFFLVIFFFSIGAEFNVFYLPQVIVPALVLGLVLLIIKPVIFKQLLTRLSESDKLSWEVGFRLGQGSEFSLLVAYLAIESKLISAKASYLIQAATLVTFIISTYFVIKKYQTPVAADERLRRD